MGSVIIIVAIVLIVLLCRFLFGKRRNKANTNNSDNSQLNENDQIQSTNNANIKKTKLYYVKYRGIVRLGIDFKSIEIIVNDDTKTISLKIPNATIIDCNVESGSMDPLYIDANEKKKSETNFLKCGYDACCKDMNEKIANDKTMLNIAKKNAESAIRGLVVPLVKQINKEYNVEFIKDENDE